MSVIDAVHWLERASTLCAASAVAYKAAFMLSPSTCEEREFLDHCTARYALLEGLLAELHGALGAAPLRDLLARLDADPSRYADRERALAAAMVNDRELGRVLARCPLGTVSCCCHAWFGAGDQLDPGAWHGYHDPARPCATAGGSRGALPIVTSVVESGATVRPVQDWVGVE